MLTTRIIPKLEVKNENLIKGIHLEGLRIVGKPEKAALRYANDGADELIFIDLVASLYQRQNWINIVRRTAEKIFIPLTVGGGIRSVEDAKTFMRAGADKVAINTGIIKQPKLVTAIAKKFGSQAMVASLEVQKKIDGNYEVYCDSGRTPTGKEPITWAKKVAGLGAGEILLTFIHQDGTYQGYDLELLEQMAKQIKIPIIASGGAGEIDNMIKAVQSGADGLAIASLLHFKKSTVKQIKHKLHQKGVNIRV